MKLFTDVKRAAAAIEQLIDRRMAAMARTRHGSPHPLEIHHAIVDEIEAQVTAGPGGSSLFPYDRVTLELLDTGSCAAALEAMFEREGGLVEDVRKRLAGRDCEIPAELTCAVNLVGAPGPGWRPNANYRLLFRRSAGDERATSRPAAATLVVSLASGEPGPTYRLVEGRTNVGRVPDVRDRDGRLIRHNVICLSDGDPRSTVSRCHAHLDAAFPHGGAACTVYDDGSRYGTRVMRDGRTIVVHPGIVGVRLRDGDELCFGSARARFRTTA